MEGVLFAPPVLPEPNMLEVFLFCVFVVLKMEDGVVPELDVVFAVPPNIPLPPLPVGAPELGVVLLGAEPNMPPELGADEVVLLFKLPKPHEEAPLVVGVLEPKPPPVAPELPPNRLSADVDGALPDEDVGGGVADWLWFPLPKLKPGALLPPPKGLELPPLVPMLPNTLEPPLVAGALNGFHPLLGVVLLNIPPPPPPDDVVAVLPNTLPLPSLFGGSLGNKLSFCPPFLPCGLRLNLFAAISPKRSAEISGFLPVSTSFCRTDILARFQSCFACCKLSCSDGALMGGWSAEVCGFRMKSTPSDSAM